MLNFNVNGSIYYRNNSVYLNTSHVKLQQFIDELFKCYKLNLNTSHVKLQHGMALEDIPSVIQFKYISC